MYDWTLNTSLEGFPRDTPREDLANAPFVEFFTQLFRKSTTNKLAVNNTSNTLLENQIFVHG